MRNPDQKTRSLKTEDKVGSWQSEVIIRLGIAD
jgi:hypothetical protein